MNHRLVNVSGSFSAGLGQNGGLWYGRNKARETKLIHIIVVSLCLSEKLFNFRPLPSRCALYVQAIPPWNAPPLKAWQHSRQLIQLSSIQTHWLFSFWLRDNGMCMFGFAGKHKSPWFFADNVPNCPHPLCSTPWCALIHSQLGRTR